MNTNENASVGALAKYETKLSPNYKRMPAYGKQIMELRLAGKMPKGIVMGHVQLGVGEDLSTHHCACLSPISFGEQ